MPEESLVWELLAVDKASETLRKVADGFADADTKLQKAAKVSGVALAAGGAAAVAFGTKAVTAASDLSETTSKIGVLFGDQAGAIQAWASTAGKALGQSQQSALDAAATFATFGKAAGLQGQDLTKFSTNLTGLASDMASFSNTTPEDAIEAIGAALRGESEPIRSYGVLLDEATLKAQAMSMGLTKASKDTDKIKAAQLAAMSAQARYNEAVKKHGEDSREANTAQAGLIRAQGALQKATEGSIAPLTNQQKVLAAQGAILAQTKAAQGDFARTSAGAANQQRILSAEIANLTANAGKALLPAFQAVVSAMVAAVGVVSDHQRLFAILGGTLAGVAATIWLVNAAQKAWAAGALIVQGVTKVWTATQWLLNVALTANPIGLVIVAVAALVAAIVIAYKHSDKFRAIVQASMRGVVAAFKWLWNTGKAVFGWIKANWKTIGTILGGPIAWAARYIIGNFSRIRAGVTGTIGSVIGFVRSIPGRIKSSLGNLAGLLFGAGGDVIRGFVRGLTDRAGSIVDAIRRTITDKLPAFVRKALDIRSPSRVMAELGRWTGLGFAEGIASTAGHAERAMGLLTDARPGNLAGVGAGAGRIRGLGASAGLGRGGGVNVTVIAQMLEPTSAAGRAIADSIERHVGRGGRFGPKTRAVLAS